MVRGVAQISLGMHSTHKTEDGFPRSEAELTQILGELINPADYPALAAVQAAESAEDLGDGEALPAALAFGVDRFLDGLKAWVAAR
ncbi:hypothetical protein [Amycolatopsis thermoflava]|uniref:hypothetical protein n=1 Tax=Amycolatopsis thermoflava TaxID=84480 RepID=UPI00041D8270|nr:hypothetical protein [Amycolatopsis thermoflava]